jgi:leucyl-tRNA synthetase
MSKSKCNVVPAAKIVEEYGADTARLFMLSDSPPERDFDWSEAGIEGSWRYLNKVWRLIISHLINLQDIDLSKVPLTFTKEALEIRKHTHKTIAHVTQCIERFHYNRYIAYLREFSNHLEEFSPSEHSENWSLYEALHTFVLLLSPALPHLAESLWEKLGHSSFIINQPWPKADPSLLVEEKMMLAIQLNGKMRGTLEASPHLTVDEAKELVLELPFVKAQIQDKSLIKFIYIPGRVVNVVF